MIPYKRKIDEELNKFDDIIKIYGGQTKQTLKEREKQHKLENPDKFKGMKIKLIYKTNNKDDEKDINDAETYLIKKLKTKYGNKCVNYLSGGGSGHSPYDIGNIYKIYIMYK